MINAFGTTNQEGRAGSTIWHTGSALPRCDQIKLGAEERSGVPSCKPMLGVQSVSLFGITKHKPPYSSDGPDRA